MRITVKGFAMLRTALGADARTLEADPGATAADLKPELLARYPELADWMPYVRVALNREYRSWDAALQDGDELALIPPVSGG